MTLSTLHVEKVFSERNIEKQGTRLKFQYPTLKHLEWEWAWKNDHNPDTSKTADSPISISYMMTP
jgi:hypothetical protein